jgi:PTH1 family peptidyl-tRNA hydrolase
MDYFVLGLGNPGSKYEKTRHNAGWIVLEHIYQDFVQHKYIDARYTHEVIGNTNVHIVLPQTFMNRSGEVIPKIQHHFSEHYDQRHLIVIHDDIDLPLGTVKVSYGRGAGGHNGVTSVMKYIGSKNLIRIRIGIAQIHDSVMVKPPVLGMFQQQEYQYLIDNIAPRIQTILTAIVGHGYEYAMNHFNEKNR